RGPLQRPRRPPHPLWRLGLRQQRGPARPPARADGGRLAHPPGSGIGSAIMADHGAHELTRVPTQIHDEASETPMWIPVLGLVLLGVAGVWFALSAAIEAEAPAAPAPIVVDAAG